MTKYYRVRTQEQWDWLMQWFENENENIKWVNGSEKPSNNKIRENIIGNGAIVNVGLYIKLDVYNSISYGYDTEMHTHDYIEVSQMMEESKMEDYVTINCEDLGKLKMDDGHVEPQNIVKNNLPFGDLLIPKSLLYPKVRMSVAGKEQFDELKNYTSLLSVAMDRITRCNSQYPHLYSKFFNHETTKKDVQAQLDFTRAWADESLIEVIPDKKWNVKIPMIDRFYFKDDDGRIQPAKRIYNDDDNQQFTTEELKQYGLDKDIFEKVEVKQ